MVYTCINKKVQEVRVLSLCVWVCVCVCVQKCGLLCQHFRVLNASANFQTEGVVVVSTKVLVSAVVWVTFLVQTCLGQKPGLRVFWRWSYQ